MTPDISLTKKQKFWLEHVQACGMSSQSMRAYAEANGLNVSSFYAWKKTLRRKGVLDEHRQVDAPLFQKAAIVREPSRQCRIILPTGLALEVDAVVDPLWLGQLVRALS